MRYPAALVVLALGYLTLARLGLTMASINPSASPIWPASGLALATVLLGGLRFWPAIFLGAFLANATTTGDYLCAFGIAVGNTLEGVIGGVLLDRFSGGRETFATPQQVAKFALVCFGLATIVGASIGVVALCLAGMAAWTNFAPIWVTWWLGDAAGAMVVTPVIVLWARTDWSAWQRRELKDTRAVVGLTVLIGLIGFSPLLPRSDYAIPLGFLVILPLLWAALRRGQRDTASVALVLTCFAVWSAIGKTGLFEHVAMNESFLLLLTVMVSVALPSLALAADVAVRRAAEARLLAMQSDLDNRERERAAALADANLHLADAQRLANLGSWSWDVADNRITWSDQLYAIFGRTLENFHGTIEEFISFVHPDDREQLQVAIGEALKSGHDFTHAERILRPDGSIRHLQSVGGVARDANGAPIRMLGVCLDVTERRLAEHALRDSEQTYRLLLKGVRDYAIYMLDSDGIVRSWNDGAARLKGYSANEILGRHFRIFLPEDLRDGPVAGQALAAAANGGQFEAQLWIVRKDGSRFFANVVLDALRDDSGALIGYAKLVRDITAQHEAQIALEQTREQLAQAQKMEGLGQLTGGIAHDFNNLLMIVSGYAQILQRRLSEPKDRQAIEAISVAAGRGERLTRQLLTFSRRQKLTPVVVDLRARIAALRDMLAPSLRGNIGLTADIDDKLWPVEVDLGELELALVNIAVNARDAMPDGGTIVLSARNVALKAGSVMGAAEGDYVALAIVDSGKGMPPEVVKRVFEPFFTTKPVGKGTGLGLSQVHGFAAQSGGAVTVASELGRGSEVTIYLPRAHAETASGVAAPEEPENVPAHGNVLLVEDSREVAEVTTALLEELGYRVVVAENGSDALRHLQLDRSFNLLRSDIVMPGPIDGLALATICSERHPGLPVLLMSGFSDAARSADGRFEILRKPFELSALERAIEHVVAQRNERAVRRGVAH